MTSRRRGATDCGQSHRLERKYPFRTPGKIDKPLRLLGLWRANRDQKSPVRRCFKSRPPLGGVRRFASGCRSFRGWLTGLLSRSPPTDTRPQARAYWANDYLFESCLNARGFFVAGEHFCDRVAKIERDRALSRRRRSKGPSGSRFETLLN